MRQQDALLLEIAESPREDHPRLIYADFLEDRGDPRGEFIRVQCELARVLEPAKRRELELREGQLLKDHRSEWTAALPPMLVDSVRFRRGFIEHVWLPGAMLAECAEELFRAAPTLNSVDLTCVNSQDFEFALQPHSLRLEELTLQGVVAIGDLRQLGGSKYLRNVRVLSLMGIHLDVAGARMLAASTGLYGVESLRLDRNHLGDEGAQEIAAMRNMPGLRRLRLFGNEIEVTGARALTLSPRFGRLDSLCLFANGIGDEGVRSLAVNAKAARLRDLDLACNRITDEGARTFVTSPLLQNLEQLDLRINNISSGCEHLLRGHFGDRVLVRSVF